MKAASDLMFNLVGFRLAADRPTLIRGGLAFGDIEHVRAIFRLDETAMADICIRSLELPRQHGAHPEYGEHYREFVLLAARCLRRARMAERAGRLEARRPLGALLSRPTNEEACRNAGALPPEFLERVVALVDAV